MTAALAHVATGKRTKLILVEHNTLTEVAKHQRFPMVLIFVKKVLYKWAHKVVAVSNGVARDLVAAIGISPNVIVTIYNPVVEENLEQLALEPVDHPWFRDRIPVILSVGNLRDQKDYPMLLRAFAHLREQFAARLVILGDGRLRAHLENLAAALGISRDVGFFGYVPNPFQFMRRCSVFVLSSKYEGFGNVLVEAMACGAPVVSTDCASGPGEIITHGRSGLLVPVGDFQRLAEAIGLLLSDESLRQSIAKNGKRDSRRFTAATIISQYEDVVSNVAKP